MEAEGAIPKAKRITYARGKEARVYTDSQVQAIVRSKPRERWLAKHPGRWAR